MNINDLVNVQISLSGSAITAESFDHILIVGTANDDFAGSPVDKYTSLADLLAAGLTSEDALYNAASVAFKNGASKLFIAVRQGEEAIGVTLDRAKAMTGWYGFAVIDAKSAEYSKIVEWADLNEKLYGFTVDVSSSIANPYGKTASRAFGFATRGISENANNAYMCIAVMTVCMAVLAGGETWAYKNLKGITADDFTKTEIKALDDAGLNYFTTCAGNNITMTGKTVEGEWIDVIRFRDWLKNKIQINVLSVLAGNPKVPYTSAGIALVEDAIVSAMLKGQEQGGIAETEYDGEEKIEGFTVVVPKITEVSEADKQNRTLVGCRFSAKLAGAIHLVDISGTLIA